MSKKDKITLLKNKIGNDFIAGDKITQQGVINTVEKRRVRRSNRAWWNSTWVRAILVLAAVATIGMALKA